MTGYLESLAVRLATGASHLPSEAFDPHVGYVFSQQAADGGFPGREGASDLYYTSFALRSLALAGRLQGDPATRAAEYLRARLAEPLQVIDFLSLIYSAQTLKLAAAIDVFAEAPDGWQDAVAGALDELRRDDGGYAKGPEGASSSTYHTFLIVIARQWIGRPLEDSESLVALIESRQRDDGGWVEIDAMRRSGTNPTAAAVAVLLIFDALDAGRRDRAIEFLRGMQTSEGGLRANTQIDIADLLSTFTGYLTLIELGAADAIDEGAAHRYAESLAISAGGFHAALWDPATDVEYTFYGLGNLALSAERASGTS